MSEFTTAANQEEVKHPIELSPAEREGQIRSVYRDMSVFNELITTLTPELREYIGEYVDQRAADPEAASARHPAIEQLIEQAARYKQTRTKRTHVMGFGVLKSGAGQ